MQPHKKDVNCLLILWDAYLCNQALVIPLYLNKRKHFTSEGRELSHSYSQILVKFTRFRLHENKSKCSN